MCIFCKNNAFGQQITKLLILTDTKDSTFLKAESMNFDKVGNYCFDVDKNGEKYFYILNNFF